MNIHPSGLSRGLYPVSTQQKLETPAPLTGLGHQSSTQLDNTDRTVQKTKESTPAPLNLDSTADYRSAEHTQAAGTGRVPSNQNCYFKNTQSIKTEIDASRENPPGNLRALKDSECCWRCVLTVMIRLHDDAKLALRNIQSGLEAFRSHLNRAIPELAGKVFKFTIDSDGLVKVMDTDDLSPLERTTLTDAIRNFKTLNNAIKSHADILLEYASFLKPREGEAPLSFENFSTYVDYGALLSDNTGYLDIFGRSYAAPMTHHDRNVISVDV
jgi:uracil-DNA glycosylase